jgi:DNA mismatch repair ATPase MutS
VGFRLGEALNPCHTLRERIEAVIAPDPPTDIRKGGAIADGAHPALDDLRHIVRTQPRVTARNPAARNGTNRASPA